MQDTILRVFVLAVSLLYPIPKEDRTGQVQEQDDHIMGMQQREDWLLRERAKLEQEVSLINQEVSPLVTQEEGPIDHKPLQSEVQQVYQIDQNHYQKCLEETLIEQKHSQENKEERSHIDHKLSQVHKDVAKTERNLSPEDKEQSTIDLSLSLTLSQGNQLVPHDQEQPDSDTEASHIDKKPYHLDKDMANANQQWPQEVQTGSCYDDQQKSPVCQEESQINQQQSKTDQEVPPIFSESSEGNQQEHLTDHLSNTRQEVKVPPNLRKSSDDQQHLTEQYNTNQEERPILSESSEDYQQQERVTNIIDWESDYTWYLWNAYSLISFVHFSIQLFRRNSQKKPHPGEIIHEDMEDISVVKNLSAEVPLPDSDTLNRFYDKRVKVSPNERWRVSEFVEGFAYDLLEAMRSMSDVVAGMGIGDFVVEGGISSLVCDIIVPIAPLEPYSFQFQLWCNQAIDEMPPEMQGCGRVKMVDGGVNQTGCPCHTAVTGDDMLCLLCDNEKVKVVKVTDVLDSALCSKNTPYLAKTQVTKWFQNAIRKVWGQISHKYEFELTFRNMDAPGALMVRFRSGKVITFNMAPVVKLKDTEAYFTIAPSTPTRNNSLDTYWSLSLATYEDHFLKYLTNHLPENSCHIHCLEIVAFLLKKQTGLTGSSALTDYHLKTVLVHLLLSKEPSDWYPVHLASRLRDTLSFLENSLQGRTLHHSFIGKPLVPSEIGLPAVFSDAEPVNLFRPLVEQNGSYTKTVKHLQEMLRNTSMLIQEYLPKPKECNGLDTT